MSPAAATRRAPQAGARVRARGRVRGTVQGVGFRPFVYRLAGELGLGGYVLNDAHGVLLEVEGAAAAVEGFFTRLSAQAPPLARIESIKASYLEPTGTLPFRILASPAGDPPDAPVAADSATCEACLRELRDPRDRRYRYPFINCTDCGPRFTIVRGVPYDRPATTMAGFAMCSACRAEYDDPQNRRFHAQPNACPRCGPSVRLTEPGGGAPAGLEPEDPLRAAASALRDGAIIAVKGIGGFHLACRADDESAVARLRGRKHREDKPFALMLASLRAARALVHLGDLEAALLCAPERPIVLAARRADAPVAAAVAPSAAELGVMLPYSPLHHLLLDDLASPEEDPAPDAGSARAAGAAACVALVMTSANVSDEPIAYHDDDALSRLWGIADLFLLHDRPIETRTDDSVVRCVSFAGIRRPLLLRRSRGYVPASLRLPGGTPQALLACGAELKSTFCLARGERAWVSHHIGDLRNYETLESYRTGIEHFKRLFAVEPEVVAHDLHPDYLSTRHALEREGVSTLAVQHHHAHLAACLAEYDCAGPAVGAIFDGSGYGLDGTLWGGELLYGDCATFRRSGSLLAVPMPGGEQAIRQPWRMACAWLEAACGPDSPRPTTLAGAVSQTRWRQLTTLARAGLSSPATSSMGRLFDAVSALCGLRPVVTYEGQAAIELESACDPHETGRYELELRDRPEGLVIDPTPAIRAIAEDLAAGQPVGVIAARFHTGVAVATVEACARAAGALGTELVVLSGGVFANRRLLEAVADGLARRGLRVLVPQRLPVGDGGISYGQAAVAAAAAAGASTSWRR